VGRFKSNHIELVIKITKYCNLRCAYCYEFPHLGDPRRMSIEQIENLFINVASFKPASASEDDLFAFIWHGGEPLMVEMAFYDDIGDVQDRVIGADFGYHNSVQTNLTILTPTHIEALVERRFFHSLGVSFDVYGDQRHDALRRPSTGKVLKNLQVLQDNGIPAGAICVLSRSTLPHLKSIFKFYERLGMALRLLPFHIEAVQGQTEVHGLTPNEIAAGMCEVFDLWLSSERPIKLYPLDIYLRNALHFLNGVRPWFYDQEMDQSVFVVDTSGDVFGHETYLAGSQYGNIFTQSFEEIADSPIRKNQADDSVQRIERYCAKCMYLGACSGYPAATANQLETQWLSADACYVAMIIGHIVRRLEQCGLGVAHADLLHGDISRGVAHPGHI
jgi:uncharacterized protein